MSHWCCPGVSLALLRHTRPALLANTRGHLASFAEDEVLDEAGRVLKWKSVLQENQATLATLYNDQPVLFKDLVAAGVPSDIRWEVWKTALGGLSNCRGYEGQYQELVRPSSWQHLIEQDSRRTFLVLPSHDKSQYCQNLQNICNAYANLDPEVGYCQGMNFVVALLLVVSDGQEEETFWVFVAIMRDMQLSGFYSGGFPLLRCYIDGCGRLVASVLPCLSLHLHAEGIHIEEFLKSWYLTLFVTCLPKAAVLEIWDEIICCSGLPVLVPLAVALLECVPISDSSQMRRKLKSLLKDVMSSKAGAIAQFLRRRVACNPVLSVFGACFWGVKPVVQSPRSSGPSPTEAQP